MNLCQINNPKYCTGKEIHKCAFYTPEDETVYSVCIDCCLGDSFWGEIDD